VFGDLTLPTFLKSFVSVLGIVNMTAIDNALHHRPRKAGFLEMMSPIFP
jgi:hypothetical protein